MLLFKCTVSRQEAGPIRGLVLKIDVSKGKLVLLVCKKVRKNRMFPQSRGEFGGKVQRIGGLAGIKAAGAARSVQRRPGPLDC